MINDKRVLAIVPARGGSKRIPGKNIKPLGGKPLIAWTIEAARQCPEIDDLIISTDDKTIADVARKYGARVPWMRPTDLATDTAASVDVIMHALNMVSAEGKTFDYVVLLQATSPFRIPRTISLGIETCCKSGGTSVVAVSPAESHPHWCYTLSEEGLLSPICPGDGVAKRSQDLPPAYVVNGSVYVSSVQYFKDRRTFLDEDSIALVVKDKKEALDIDDKWDWELAEFLLAQEKK